MGKALLIILTVFLTGSCSDDNTSGPDSKRDSPMEPQSVDSSSLKGDTSMYQRMPNKMNDSTQK